MSGRWGGLGIGMEQQGEMRFPLIGVSGGGTAHLEPAVDPQMAMISVVRDHGHGRHDPFDMRQEAFAGIEVHQLRRRKP